MNLNNPNNYYWDTNNYVNVGDTSQQITMNNMQQMPLMYNASPQPNNLYKPMNTNVTSVPLNRSNMQDYVFGQNNTSGYDMYQNNNNMYCSLPNTSSSINSQIVMASMEKEEIKEIPAPMRLPTHVTRPHFRSNSLTPADTGKYMSNTFLFDQLKSPSTPGKLQLNKISSEDVTSSHRFAGRMFDSSNSLPAIRNMSDYYESVASESSIFDGKDSALASSLDLSLDTNGQPLFDNMSMNDDSANPNANVDNSEEIPIKPKLGKRIKVPKKSGF